MMKAEEFSSLLYVEMEKELLKINNSSLSILESSQQCSSIILKFIARLKSFIINYSFESKLEEINFFKNIKPRFLSKLIYFQNVYKIQFHLPLGTATVIKEYHLREVEKINDYINSNIEFYSYYRSQSTFLDETYFIRKEPDSWLLLNFENLENDLQFTTMYDQKISKIIAFKSLSDYLKRTIENVEIKKDSLEEVTNTKANIHWTSSKVSLVELLYALQSAGTFNNGTMDIKELAGHLERFFNIDLGNYYRVFQDMRIRKINRTSFLDQLKERLTQRMNDADENPRFK